jgi:hypothetical protein
MTWCLRPPTVGLQGRRTGGDGHGRQRLLTAASLDLAARICVVAFSAAVPLLAALVLVNRRELSQHRATRSRLVVSA